MLCHRKKVSRYINYDLEISSDDFHDSDEGNWDEFPKNASDASNENISNKE